MSGFYEVLDLYLILYTMYQFMQMKHFLLSWVYQGLNTDKTCSLLCATKGETDQLATNQGNKVRSGLM